MRRLEINVVFDDVSQQQGNNIFLLFGGHNKLYDMVKRFCSGGMIAETSSSSTSHQIPM